MLLNTKQKNNINNESANGTLIEIMFIQTNVSYDEIVLIVQFHFGNRSYHH